ncbi:hypothetical protein [Streptomyces sp. CC77]|uniref:hypothetical protein n=1 Tax=Streptomyces sp. CC77 TaxID=1906739 RepID=UPI00090FB44D|nr:hypothetical protein [Streptomyces sp. CC77]OII69410.1 hypothetical protein BJP39_17780 [Streptomyces sp. CC77]
MAFRAKAVAAAVVVVAALVPVPPAAAVEDPPPLASPAPEPPEAAPPPAPGAPGVAVLLTRLQGLYQDAEQATETYDAAEEELTALAARTRRLTRELAGARDAAARARAEAGRFARAQYRGRAPQLPLPLRLLFARDARAALDGERTLRRAAAVEAAAVARTAGAERRADALAGAAREDLDRQQTLLARQRQARDTARLRLLEAAGILAALPPGELAALAELEAARADTPLGTPPAGAGQETGSARDTGPGTQTGAGPATGAEPTGAAPATETGPSRLP